MYDKLSLSCHLNTVLISIYCNFYVITGAYAPIVRPNGAWHKKGWPS